MPNSNKCSSCQSSKSLLECGLCKCVVCKRCAEFLDEDQFSFLAVVPEELQHGVFCPSCFENSVATQLATYNETMDKAKEIQIFQKNQGKETRLIKRLADKVYVKNVRSYEEAVLRLAFFAVQANYNGVVDVDVVSEKIRDEGYQTTRWSGSGIPADIQADRLVKDRSTWQNPN